MKYHNGKKILTIFNNACQKMVKSELGHIRYFLLWTGKPVHRYIPKNMSLTIKAHNNITV